MKKILKNNSIFLLIAGLVLLNQPGLFVKNENPALASKKASTPTETVSIKIVANTQNSTVVIGQDRNNLASCSFELNLGSNLVQDALPLNLNQPANCFNLNLGKVTVQQEIAVQALAAASPQIKVIKLPQVAWSSEAFTPVLPFNAAVPVLPLVVCLVLIALALKLISLMKKSLKCFSISNSNLSLPMLQILRC